jgi:hypothetical protein
VQVREILRKIASEARILDIHLSQGKLDREFLRNHADNLVNYGLLLRDLSVEKHPTEKPFWKNSENDEEGHSSARDRFEFFADL